MQHQIPFLFRLLFFSMGYLSRFPFEPQPHLAGTKTTPFSWSIAIFLSFRRRETEKKGRKINIVGTRGCRMGRWDVCAHARAPASIPVWFFHAPMVSTLTDVREFFTLFSHTSFIFSFWAFIFSPLHIDICLGVSAPSTRGWGGYFEWWVLVLSIKFRSFFRI